MALIHDVKVEFAERSARVKSVDVHPTEPWILTSMHSGRLSIWNYESKALINSIEVTELPVRSAKFIAQKEWIISGADDKFIRVFNDKTSEKIIEFEAHTDYIRCVVVHPTLPFVLSASDDHSVRLWDWANGWSCARTFEGHSHYVMQVAFNPKNQSIFASASLDGTVKTWNLNSPEPIATLDAHPKGVNCVNYFMSNDKLCLLSGSDDHTTKVWDYESKSCVATLEGHTNNVTTVNIHPEFPIIITGSEDETIRIWNTVSYKIEKTLNQGLGRVWAIEFVKGSSQVVIGYDEGHFIGKIISSSDHLEE
ncbi:hypothetical protein Nepgr_016107 [Nepenthes gracilis]|uniref:Beta'-coat protein n=1 Tax=Nepenthes gracilis TaxID=150966 RepID=A0AAD3XRY4_NEPGR|nr:hypothetical protein Nepgr_016107 [Nepenthes gracilis]